MNIIHLLSGGLDSVTLLHKFRDEGNKLHCLLVDYQQKHVRELEYAKGHCNRLDVPWSLIKIPALHGLTADNWIVPFRNAILISFAVNLAVQRKADAVAIACNADDAAMFPDCRRTFLASMARTIDSADYKIELLAPFLDWEKWRIAGLAREIRVPLNEIWTCYAGGPEPCGVCPACQKLKAALNA